MASIPTLPSGRRTFQLRSNGLGGAVEDRAIAVSLLVVRNGAQKRALIALGAFLRLYAAWVLVFEITPPRCRGALNFDQSCALNNDQGT